MTAFADDSPSAPPRPRKLPQQGRSRLLVESTKQACLQILQKEGPRALTATRIADVAGVAMGSLYQYFPNVDAIVATVYEDLTAREIEIALQKWETEWGSATLEQALLGVIRGSIRFHRNMLALDREFHQRFYMNFDLENWFNEAVGNPAAALSRIRALLRRHQTERRCTDPEIQGFIIHRAITSLIRDCVKYAPEYLENPAFAHHLFRLVISVVDAPLPAPATARAPDQAD